MEAQIQEEKPVPRKPVVPNWVVHILLSAISIVFGKLMLQSDKENTELRKDKVELIKDKVELQSRIDSCYSHRFDEMTHREDEKSNEIRELREENKRRFDSLINNQMRILKK